MNNQVMNEEIEIDLIHLVKILWKKAWLIVLSMILVATIAFSYAMFFVTPQYTSTAMMYVNNSSISLGAVSFTASELSAAKSLLDVYLIILKSRTTLEEVIEETGLNYSYSQLSKMVSASSVNSTEVFQIAVTASDPVEAELIVDTIVDILPERIADIVDGSSVRVVDHAVLPLGRSTPSYTRYAMIGMVLGFVISCACIIVIDLMDTTVRNEEYLYQKYGMPVLAVVPDAGELNKGTYSYYYKQDVDAVR